MTSDDAHPTDAELVRTVLAGRSAQSDLVTRYEAEVLAWATAAAPVRLRSKFSRSDVAQDTFRLVLRDLSEFDPSRGSFRSWLRTVGANHLRNLIDHHEGTAPHRPREVAISNDSSDQSPDVGRRSPLSDVAVAEEKADLVRAIAQLSLEDRLAIVATDFAKLEWDHVAKLLGSTEVAAKARHVRARRKLKDAVLRARGSERP